MILPVNLPNCVIKWPLPERFWLLLSMLVCLISSTGCQGLGQVFRRDAVTDIARARQWTNGGLEALENGKLDQASSCFNRALEHAPTDRRIRTHLADTHARKGDYDQAISQMLRVVESSNDPGQNVALGKLYLANGQWLPAVRQAELALSRNRKLSSAWALRGKTRYAKADYQGALADYHRALGLEAGMLDVHLHMANTYRKLDQPMRALAALEQLLARYPVDQQPEAVLVAKGSALMEVQQLDEAIDLLARTSRRDNASAEPFLLLGQAQYLAGYISESRTTLNKARRMFPERDDLKQAAVRLASNDSGNVLTVQDASTPLIRK